MPELVEQMYCSQQIVIPPKFPYILKRYCKAAIKTQPYDLLRWSFEYFKALAQRRPPPVKLRLEYPVFSTEGGLTRGCLKVLANQLAGMAEIPLPVLKQAWEGFCLDPQELRRILCLCEVYLRKDTVPFLHFLAVAGGLLTKCLTHTMILLCESLTKEPDGGSAAIPVSEFLVMYKFIAKMDAAKDVRYFNGFREGEAPDPESVPEEEEIQEQEELHGDRKLREISATLMSSTEAVPKQDQSKKIEEKVVEKKKEGIEIIVLDEDENEIPFEFYGEPKEVVIDEELGEEELPPADDQVEEQQKEEQVEVAVNITEYVAEAYAARMDRLEDLEQTIDEIAAIVNRFKSANYDLGMVAGRQMSTTSGEFIVQHIEKEIMAYIDEQIAILPDPDLKKKKAKPEEVEMIKQMLETFLDENMDIIVPEVEEVEEEEQPIPEITIVYAVPGIGPPVDLDIISEFQDYALDVCKVQADLFMPRNIRHFLCPPLEKYDEHKYELTPPHTPKKEQKVPTGGTITD
ncbi:titin-like isoform X2 [Ostrinia nubilalis]|uniref:titin-like isoform X2 n=1 Tax=Ostrinia nubilalis TaxID=29057 RepID=UPI0030825941